MKENRRLNINGTMLEKSQLDKYLEKIAASHNICTKSDKTTYPIPGLLEDFEFIKEVYDLLNQHLKLEITIHPAGEWLLDNLYIIEEAVKQIKNELTLKKYTNFVGIANGEYKGFARIYVLAQEIVAYTDCKIDNKVEKEDVHDFYFPNILYNALLRESLGSQELSAYDLFWIIRISHQTEKMKMKRQQKLSTYPKISQVFIQKDQEKPFLVIIDELGHKYRYDTMYPEKVLQIYGLLKAEQKDVTLEDLGKEINHVR